VALVNKSESLQRAVPVFLGGDHVNTKLSQPARDGTGHMDVHIKPDAHSPWSRDCKAARVNWPDDSLRSRR
jgi:hypothetical protein